MQKQCVTDFSEPVLSRSHKQTKEEGNVSNILKTNFDKDQLVQKLIIQLLFIRHSKCV